MTNLDLYLVVIPNFWFLHSDMSGLDESNTIHNNQLAFSILESELGIPPVMSAIDLANSGQIDKLSMVFYLTQVQNAFTAPAKGTIKGMYQFRINKWLRKGFCELKNLHG